MTSHPDPAMTPPTARQARVLAFIRTFIERHGYPPTRAEIAKGLRFRSPNAAGEHLRLLAKKGIVSLTPGIPRGLRIEAGAEEASSPPGATLPLVGQVAAGQPILAEENVERNVEVDAALFRPRPQFLLRVRGDSMIDAGILPGDLVAVSKTTTIRDGEIAVVRIDEDVTVKRWRTERSGPAAGGRRPEVRVVLEPANPAYAPIVVDPSRAQVAVEGRVVGVLRLQVT
jgi:repressor LexA